MPDYDGCRVCVAPTPNAVATNCGAGTVTATAGANSFSLAGASSDRRHELHGCHQRRDARNSGHVYQHHSGRQHHDHPGGHDERRHGQPGAYRLSVTINKSFSPTTVAIGTTTAGNPNFSTLSIQIRNNNARAINLTGVGLTDTWSRSSRGWWWPIHPPPLLRGRLQRRDDHRTGRCDADSSCRRQRKHRCDLHTVRAGRRNDFGQPDQYRCAASITSAQGVTNPLQGTATLAVTGS